MESEDHSVIHLPVFLVGKLKGMSGHWYDVVNEFQYQYRLIWDGSHSYR